MSTCIACNAYAIFRYGVVPGISYISGSSLDHHHLGIRAAAAVGEEMMM